MTTCCGRSKELPLNISVCHMIKLSDRIAILFFICSLIFFYHNFDDKNARTYRVAMTISKMATCGGSFGSKGLMPPNISIHYVINIKTGSDFFLICSLINFNQNVGQFFVFKNFQDGHPWSPELWGWPLECFSRAPRVATVLHNLCGMPYYTKSPKIIIKFVQYPFI